LSKFGTAQSRKPFLVTASKRPSFWSLKNPLKVQLDRRSAAFVKTVLAETPPNAIACHSSHTLLPTSCRKVWMKICDFANLEPAFLNVG